MKKSILAIAFLGILFSCGKNTQEAEIPVSSISLSQPAVEMVIGEAVQLTATVQPSNASSKAITWASSKASVATVESGRVTAIAEGTATITASAGGKSATCAITVGKGVIAVTSVELNKTTLELVEGESDTLVVTVKPSDATDKTVAWSTSSASIATVENGKVTAIKEGEATITATAGGKSATCKVVVAKKVIAVSSVELNKTTLELVEEESETLVATVKPDDATDKTVTWSTSDASVATVEGGKVTAIKEGTATITAKVGDKSAECKVIVSLFIPTAVDLGLSVRWASCNLGAFRPEESGDYYAWGEIDIKDKYLWSNYKFNLGTGRDGPFSKYNLEDKKKVLDLEDDVAHVKLGGSWRMPTIEECHELIEQCDINWTTYNGTGIKGCIITATNGNSIFLPACGYKDYYKSPSSSSMGFYWTSFRYNSPGCAHYIGFEYDASRHGFNIATPYSDVCYGLPVRPVVE